MPEAKREPEGPLLDLLREMTRLSLERSWLDEREVVLTRIAALAASDAAPASYALNLGAAEDLEISPEDIRGVLVAIAPVVGTARIVSSLGNIAKLNVSGFDELKELETDPSA